jgi:hypothetical protein
MKNKKDIVTEIECLKREMNSNIPCGTERVHPVRALKDSEIQGKITALEWVLK